MSTTTITEYIPGNAFEAAQRANGQLPSSTQKALNGAEKHRKGRGFRYLTTFTNDDATALVKFWAEHLNTKLPLAEQTACINALKRLNEFSATKAASPVRNGEPKEKKAPVVKVSQADNAAKAREARSRYAAERREKIERFEKANNEWLGEHRPLPTPNDILASEQGTEAQRDKLAQAAVAERIATDRCKDLYLDKGRARNDADEAEKIAGEIVDAEEERTIARSKLYEARFACATKAQRTAATAKQPRPESFDLTAAEVAKYRNEEVRDDA